MGRAIFLQAFRDYTRFKRIIPWLILALAGALLAVVWTKFSAGQTNSDRYSVVSYLLVFRVLALSSAIFTTAIISSEVEQRTIVYLLTRPVPRWRLLLVRFGASVLVVIGLSVFAALCASVAVYGFNFGANPLLLRDIEALVIGALAYGALFLFVSLLFNRAMIICLLFAFGWESSVPQMPGTMFYLSIFSHLQGIANHPVKPDGILAVLVGTSSSNNLTARISVPVLLVFSGIVLLVSAWWFTHFEYVPREDAE